MSQYLFVPDLQMPFEHPKALEFCSYLKKHYKIPDDHVYCVGDETDQYWGSMWKKDPNARHTASQEITETREHLKPWFAAFPQMRIAVSNHGTRWQRKALDAEIPEILLRRYENVLGAPKGWRWQKRWLIKSKAPMLVEHGDRFGGKWPHAIAAETNAVSTIIGHHHAVAGIEHIGTRGAKDGCADEGGYEVWGMSVGSMIDFEQYAFNYAREARKKPRLGVGLVLDDGRLPIWLPFYG
jgi:hypothetical protein